MDGAHGGSGRPARFATAMKRNLLIGLCLLLAANIGAQPPIQSKPAKESTLVRGMSFVAIDAWLFDNPAIVKPAYSGGIPLAGLRWGYCLFEFNDKGVLTAGAHLYYGQMMFDKEIDGQKKTGKFSRLILGPDIAYHYTVINRLDLFVHLRAGIDGGSFFAASAKFTKDFPAIEYGITAGISYHFTPHFGIFAEGGYGSKFFGCGISYCFRDPLSKYLGGASGRYDF